MKVLDYSKMTSEEVVKELKESFIKIQTLSIELQKSKELIEELKAEIARLKKSRLNLR